ncbi:YcjF family protein [Hyphomicrobium sp.]|jgi:putative membrane protein|uniref:YcjF family protein n=1 Tax=Hyphomicrobium sp. TaxID=82 RepID=UPI003564CCB2
MSFEDNTPPPRKPRVFKADDITEDAEFADADIPAGGAVSSRRSDAPSRRLSVNDINRGFRFSSVLFSAMAALASIAAGLWFTRFVSVALERQDWIGWVAFGLMVVIALALVGIVLRELLGFRRLARLAKLRTLVRATLAKPDAASERKAVSALLAHYRGRPDLSWGLARVKDHSGDVLAPGELLRLSDRELLHPLDGEARKVILASAKRVATVTALSPIMWIAMGFVLVENVRMFRAIAGLYGGRPGILGALRLARNVVGHVIATGGIAMTDDLLGQFVGQDVLRRLSRRLGEGAFNGALTSRLGVVAVEVIRPLPYLDSEPLRVREIFNELIRSLRGADKQAEG